METRPPAGLYAAEIRSAKYAPVKMLCVAFREGRIGETTESGEKTRSRHRKTFSLPLWLREMNVSWSVSGPAGVVKRATCGNFHNEEIWRRQIWT